MSYTASWYASPIQLPARKHGNVEVRHRTIPVGEEVQIVGIRQAITRGVRQVSGITQEPLLVHELVEGKTLWMTDLPEELNQIAELLYCLEPEGKVLVGGLGLGILTTAVARFPGVMSVTTVERSASIIHLCSPHHPNVTVRHGDIADYLKTTKTKYDYILLDTWCGTSEGTWWTDVMPLKRIVRNRWGKRPYLHCWAEDIMEGQIYRSMTNPHTRPHWYYKYLPIPMPESMAQLFLTGVGLPEWEQAFGDAVDRGLSPDAAPA